jgi:dihydrofolate reductase
VTTIPADRPRASVFIATSVDGFIARPDDGLDWLTGKPDDELTGEHDPGQDFGYGEFFASVDALLMGRGTFDVVSGFAGDWPYGDKPIYVWTSHPDDIVAKDGAVVRPVTGSLDDVVARLVADGIGHVYVDGGKVIRQLLAAGLIDRMTISTPPVLIGEGIPLFGGTGADIRLDLVSCETFDGGMVQRVYDVVR